MGKTIQIMGFIISSQDKLESGHILLVLFNHCLLLSKTPQNQAIYNLVVEYKTLSLLRSLSFNNLDPHRS